MLNETQVSVCCFDPGIFDTPMLRQAFPKSLNLIFPLFKRFIAKTPAQGAATGVWLSNTSFNNLLSGAYYKNEKIKKVSKLAKDNSAAEWLWNESERLTGFRYA